MNQVVQPGQEIKADAEVVQNITDEFTELLLQRMVEARVTYPDAFMILHNVHKKGLYTIAMEWEKAGIPREKTFRMADMTFRKAVRDLWRKLPTKV